VVGFWGWGRPPPPQPPTPNPQSPIPNPQKIYKVSKIRTFYINLIFKK